jgi:hypothetical protein
MTYYQFTEKHRLTLRNRLLQAGCPTAKNATIGHLEDLCYNYGIPIEVEPATVPTVLIQIEDGKAEFIATGGTVNVVFIDIDTNNSDEADADFSARWERASMDQSLGTVEDLTNTEFDADDESED